MLSSGPIPPFVAYYNDSISSFKRVRVIGNFVFCSKAFPGQNEGRKIAIKKKRPHSCVCPNFPRRSISSVALPCRNKAHSFLFWFPEKL